MPPLVEPKPMNSAPENSSPDNSAPLTLRDRISALRARRKVFYDSPGLLDQSHHWGGLVIWTIAVGTTAGLIWAFLGKVDQTVMASGTLEPATGKVDVRSTSGGIVKKLWVREGAWVDPGDRLVEIENLALQARLDTTMRQLSLLRYENGLFNLLIDGGGKLPVVLPAPPAAVANEARVRSVQLTVQQTASQLRQLQDRVRSQQETLGLKQSLSDSLSQLYQNGGYAKYSYLEARDQIQQIRSQVSQTKEQINIIVSEAGRQVSNNDRQILNLEAERVGQQESRRNLVLKATGSGRIFNLALRPGSVIGAGTELMRIVPEGALRAKVYLANTDLGFVKEGQKAKISVSSFPAGEYGYLDAKVTRIGADALDSASQAEQQKANTYPLQITLEPNKTKQKLLEKLHPGMQVSTLIVVRQRPVISLFTEMFTKGTEGLKNSR